MPRYRTHRPILLAAARHGVLSLTACFCLLPFIWMVSLSVKSPTELFTSKPSFWPSRFHGKENYTRALTKVPLARFMMNGVFVCSAILGLQISTAAPCAYALAKLRFRGKSTVFAFVLIGLLIPHQVLALPLFVGFNSLHLLNTYAALILPSAVSPFGIFILRQRFKSVPDELLHAARLDGFSEFSIVWRILLPLSIPSLATFSIFSLITHWNDLFWPLIAIRSTSLATPPLGVAFFASEEAGNAYGPLMAGATMIVAPLIIAFLFAQRRFVEGATMGATK